MAVIECLIWDWGAAGSSLTSFCALCPWARHINPSLVQGQPRKTHPSITERLLMGHKESYQTNKPLLLYYKYNVVNFFLCFCCCQLTFFNINFFKKFFQEPIKVSNSLDPDQVWPSDILDLDPNSLQRLSAVTKFVASKERVKCLEAYL